MNAEKIYNEIITRAKKREFVYGEPCERHHIIPRSCGGSNKKVNLIDLTMKEHHICHLLLLRMGKCRSYYFAGLSSKEYIFLKKQEKIKFITAKLKW